MLDFFLNKKAVQNIIFIMNIIIIKKKKNRPTMIYLVSDSVHV